MEPIKSVDPFDPNATPADSTHWVRWYHFRLPESEWGYVRCRPAVIILAIDERGFLLLETLTRPIIRADLLELPKGFIEDNEKPLDAAKRELLEETGLASSDWRDLGEFLAAPGVAECSHRLFAARVKSRQEALVDKAEGISRITWVSLQEVVDMVKSGKVIDTATIAFIFKGMNLLSQENTK